MSTSTLTATTTSAGNRRQSHHISWLVLGIATALAMAAVMAAALLYAKPAVNLAGDEQAAQRIFYLHMGSVIGALVAFLMSVVGSLVYLIKRDLDWDRVAQASVEIGIVFGLSLTLAGSIWSKPTWNTYWTWDPRLTTTTLTILIYIAYLLFRHGIDSRRTRAQFSSIYALFAFLSVPLTYYSARWFRSIHPVVFNGANPDAQGSFNIGATMTQTLWMATIGYCFLFSALLIFRWRQLRMEDRIAALREEVE
ncbi:MAG: cytochrome c biogenesis protein CcsA [Caldilineaceae bacterium]|nr:cytochrome c biogenesis protein CcsA [Caldilineaceae bacterium]